ncbi:3'(2'),5'-bisphosphate nucleotidase CysQ [Accumulibacter sp.]|uniref:3'(2'),5'-bisphosphate nucleotidase CysQ n=1 Tax=Accumulibacter sp. TaxID=2053492 RepID=UPI0025D627D4|nr:3'(2'),5'-bisphosphate nucleotidase CysQ [Accumulibacter sp.]MCM8595339.1 3'(2'),5'-bisphosphate nucleotidase CysQ [Accumulibacter sp.]MCM8625318.1 3'(2'),5'-bisphosphate nucleotidase CysQ [Accumulibacter sp.]MDS4049486.1 3'(2'),5'-bisphosphate nucleotidase CysQ [Accumulibacter sp.]
MTERELGVLCALAEAAGLEILDVYARNFASWQKDDASPLTEADLRADKVVREGLEAHFPGVFILSEESVSAAGRDSDALFLVDPLDGTKEFLKRNDEFTVNIALADQQGLVAGVVLAPALGELFYAARGLGAAKRDAGGMRGLRVARCDEPMPLRVIGSRSHGGEALTSWLGKLPRTYGFVAAGSSLKFCRIAEGRADIYPRFGPTSQWDTAAAQCVLEMAGGAVTDLNGASLRYGLDGPTLNPEFVAVGDRRLLALATSTT